MKKFSLADAKATIKKFKFKLNHMTYGTYSDNINGMQGCAITLLTLHHTQDIAEACALIRNANPGVGRLAVILAPRIGYSPGYLLGFENAFEEFECDILTNDEEYTQGEQDGHALRALVKS